MTTLCALPDMPIRSGEQKHFCLLLFARPLAPGYRVRCLLCVERCRGMWVSGWRLSGGNSHFQLHHCCPGKAVNMRNVCPSVSRRSCGCIPLDCSTLDVKGNWCGKQKANLLTFLWLLYVPPGLTYTVPMFCPHIVFMCFVWISEQTAIISLYSINWLVCVNEMECVYCAVRTGCLCTIQFNCERPCLLVPFCCSF
jgi:hypothetical protein